MAVDEEPPRIPAVTSVAGLAWLLFMRPLRLHFVFRSWSLLGDPPVIKVWPRIRAREPVILALLGRLAALLFLVTPAMTFGSAATLLQLASIPVTWLGVAKGIAYGMAGGAAFGVVLGVMGGAAGGVVFGVASGVAFSVASGVAFGVTLGARS